MLADPSYFHHRTPLIFFPFFSRGSCGLQQLDSAGDLHLSSLDARHSVAEAARNASPDRFRVVFITAATIIAGLVPLLFETSMQA